MNIVVAMTLFAFPATLLADDEDAPGVAAEADDVEHDVGVTISPLHLSLPIFEITGEYRVADDIGVAAILGGGKIRVEDASGTTEHQIVGIEVGAQFRYYVFGSFIHGMQLGAEVLYLYLDRQDTDTVSVDGAGLAMGPFVGYKIATNVGFTFDAQLGTQYMAVRAKASESVTGAKVERSESAWIPLLNLNVGWSF